MRQGSGPTFVFHQNSNIPLITLDTASSTITHQFLIPLPTDLTSLLMLTLLNHSH